MRVTLAEDKQTQMDPDKPVTSPQEDEPPQAGRREGETAAAHDAVWQQLDAAFDGLEAALAQRQQRWDGELRHLQRQLEAAKADNARLEELLKAEQARVQRLEDLTSAVSGRVDSAIGELESILDS